MPCTTPSHPEPIPSGQAVDISAILAETDGSLHANGQSMYSEAIRANPGGRTQKSTNLRFLQAQAVTSKQNLNHLFARWDVEGYNKSYP